MQLYFQVLSSIPEIEAVPGQHLSVNTSNVRWPVAVMRLHGSWAIDVMKKHGPSFTCLTKDCGPCPLKAGCPQYDDPEPIERPRLQLVK